MSLPQYLLTFLVNSHSSALIVASVHLLVTRCVDFKLKIRLVAGLTAIRRALDIFGEGLAMGGKGRGKGTVSGVVKAMREKGRKRSWHEGREGEKMVICKSF